MLKLNEKNEIKFYLLIFFMISYKTGILGQVSSEEKINIPPLPENEMDTQIFKEVSYELKSWIEGCIWKDFVTQNTEQERDNCEKEILKHFILKNIRSKITEDEGIVTLEYLIEKERKIGWIKIKEDTTRGKIGKILKESFEKIKLPENDGGNWKWSYPSSKYRLCRLLKEITIEIN